MWLHSIDLQSVISAALKPPEANGTSAAFEYTRGLSRETVAKLLDDANLGGLTDVIVGGIEVLQHQAASTAYVLNNT
eukprot:690932-Prymnesium_polylepis.1